ncbi:MAG: hypothetical protein LBG45_05865, partial [Dysgonamonadaceae bacterium]|nr:hypothetical protein [Dysgonamonadaceae bacterium]
GTVKDGIAVIKRDGIKTGQLLTYCRDFYLSIMWTCTFSTVFFPLLILPFPPAFIIPGSRR